MKPGRGRRAGPRPESWPKSSRGKDPEGKDKTSQLKPQIPELKPKEAKFLPKKTKNKKHKKIAPNLIYYKLKLLQNI